MSSIEADGLRALMATQHSQNRGDISELKAGQEKLETGQKELRNDLTELTSEITGGVRVLKALGWIIGVAITVMGIWFASLEARGKIADNRPAGVSSLQAPQVSGAGAIHY